MKPKEEEARIENGKSGRNGEKELNEAARRGVVSMFERMHLLLLMMGSEKRKRKRRRKIVLAVEVA